MTHDVSLDVRESRARDKSHGCHILSRGPLFLFRFPASLLDAEAGKPVTAQTFHRNVQLKSHEKLTHTTVGSAQVSKLWSQSKSGLHPFCFFRQHLEWDATSSRMQ